MISFLLYLFYRPVSASQLFFSKYLIFVVLGVAPRPLEHEEEIVPAQPPFSRNICLEEYLRISLQRIYDYLIEEYLFKFAVKNKGKR